MIKEVKLPEVSDNIEHGDVVKVLVNVGDTIDLDQPIIELETDKAMFEVPSTEKGVVKEINVKAGDVINIGAVILKVESNGSAEEKSDTKKEAPATNGSVKKVSEEEKEEKVIEKEVEVKNKSDEEPVKKKSEEIKEEVNEKEDEVKNKSNEETPVKKEIQESKAPSTDLTKEPAPASPSVRRLARELGVDINMVKGTQKGNRISEDDVKNFVKERMSGDGSSGSPGQYQKALPDFSKWGEVDLQPMSKVRSITAESLSYAWSTIPMVTQFDKCDITNLEEFRKSVIEKSKDKENHLTITSILVKICTEALRKFPQFNSSIDFNKREIFYKKYFNVGVAVDTDRGLLVPVIKNSDKKNITHIAEELSELAEKARTKKITPEEMDGGNFTISNLGGIGGTSFTPIVYSPQVAILGVSRGNKEAVFVNDKIEQRLMLPLSLTYDHRIIDGADAARFLRWICEALQNPISMLL